MKLNHFALLHGSKIESFGRRKKEQDAVRIDAAIKIPLDELDDYTERRTAFLHLVECVRARTTLEHRVLLLAGGVAQGNRQMGFAQSHSAHKDDVGVVFQESQPEEVLDLWPVDFPGPVPVELFQGFEHREAGGDVADQEKNRRDERRNHAVAVGDFVSLADEVVTRCQQDRGQAVQNGVYHREIGESHKFMNGGPQHWAARMR
jgi:hypothetical protein